MRKSFRPSAALIPLCLYALISLCSCGRSGEKTTTDMVQIPATAGEGRDTTQMPVMKFEEETFDFGTITQGEKVTHDFKFKNTGKTDLIISNAYGSCGCTIPEVPRNPVPPGGENIIRVNFDSDGKQGMVTKTVTMMTNCATVHQVIKIKANIFIPQSKNPS